jgi:hypothetical protein
VTLHLESSARQAPPLIRLAEELRTCLEKWDAARRERHAQQVRHGVDGSADALRAEWDALTQCAECRQALAQTGALLLRLALEEFPAAMRVLLADTIIDVMADELPAAVRALNGKGALRV